MKFLISSATALFLLLATPVVWAQPPVRRDECARHRLDDRLADVLPNGRSHFLGEGVLRARHRDPQRGGAFNSERLSTINPDQAYEYAIDFWRPTGNLFARGHRIRIEISSSYYPYYLRNLNTGEDNIGLAKEPVVARQTIFHHGPQLSHVVLPVIPARK